MHLLQQEQLVLQVMTDEGAKLFMSKVSCGELPLEQAKNLLIAFSRLKTANKKNENV